MRPGWMLPTTVLAVMVVTAQGPAPAPGNPSIRATDLEADVRFLAGDSMQGRLTDTDGNRQAAEFIASRFARLGLVPVGSDGTHFHRFDLVTTELRDDNALRVTGHGQTEPELGAEFYPEGAFPISRSSV